jgi:hypothetical protein
LFDGGREETVDLSLPHGRKIEDGTHHCGTAKPRPQAPVLPPAPLASSISVPFGLSSDMEWNWDAGE